MASLTGSRSHDSSASSSDSAMMGPVTPVVSSGTSSDIKSTAVVQYNSVKFPVPFQTIRLNTDLNHPPSDRNSGFYMFTDQPMHNTAPQFSQFLSLNMANAYQDSVGEVDVISSAKNIKALLKMPYSDSRQISIIVHRLRKTLLLEEFDAHKNVMKWHEEEWKWMKWLTSYFKDVIKKEKEDPKKCLVSANPKRESFSENMYLNLIRHSCAASAGDNSCTALETAEDQSKLVDSIPELSQDLKGFHHETLWKFEDISMLIDSDLPIFGSGETRRPCISLRLRDARSPPINVLTGLDYWLDNLMSNVPEVAMCYHYNGLVQKYEVMKTEDIPNLQNSSFDPNEVLDIAQNIMSFIKRNAAVEGHTYWLYKSENDEMVKLYDLTNYCQDEIGDGDNPFTVPVGLLCHRVGRNLKRTNQRRTADARAMFENCIRLLDEIKHAQVCADAHLHLSDMWVPDKSVNDVWQEKGKISDPPSDLYDEDEDGSDENNVSEQNGGDGDEKLTDKSEESGEMKNSVALKELVVRGMIKKKAWEVVQSCRIAGTTDERCRVALSHIRKGLNCVDKDQIKGKNIGLVEKQQTSSPSKAIPLHYASLKPDTVHKNSKDDKETSHSRQESPQRCNPFTAIPLHYVKLNSEKESSVEHESSSKSSQSDKENSSEETSSSNGPNTSDSSETCSGIGETSFWTPETSSESWHVQAKFQLLRKAAITYFVLAKEFFEIKKYGHALRHLRYAVHCYEALELLNKNVREESQDQELYLMLLYLAARVRCCLVFDWHAGHRDFVEIGEEEAAILHSAQSVLSTPNMAWVYEWPSSKEANMKTVEELYEKALRLPILEKKPTSFKLGLKKFHAACIMTLGNIQMEIFKENTKKNGSFESLKSLWETCLKNNYRAIDLFEGLNDRNTAGHVCCNIAYLHIVASSAKLKNVESKERISPVEREHLDKALEWHEKALSLYERGEKMDDARETVCNNIRKQYQQMASRYFNVQSGEVTEQDLVNMREFLQKSLQYCFLDSGGKHLKQSQTCAAVNHLNLARLFDVKCSKYAKRSCKRNLRQKMEGHFQKSFELYDQIKWRRSQMCVKFFWIHTFLDEVEEKSLGAQAKKKLIKVVFGHLCDLCKPLVALQDGDFDSEDSIHIYPSNISVVKQLLKTANGAFCCFLKLDITNTHIKQLYQRSLRLTPLTEVNELASPLSSILIDLKSLLASDHLH